MKGKNILHQFALSLVMLGLLYPDVSGQENQSHLEDYKIPSGAVRMGPFSRRGSSEYSYCTYAVKANNQYGQEIIAREYFENGKRTALKLYKDKKQHGVWKTWYLDGALESESCYNMGISDGVFKTWNKAGQLISSYVLKKGTGRKKVYHDNGRLKVDQRYKKDVLIGNSFSFYDNGQVRSMSWRSGKSPIGISFGFYRDGKISRIITFDKNVDPSDLEYLKGVSVRFLDNGSVYKIDYRIGETKLTKQDYMVARKMNKSLPPIYEDPKKYKEWLTDEMKRVIENYKKEKPVKIPLEFDPNGMPIKK